LSDLKSELERLFACAIREALPDVSGVVAAFERPRLAAYGDYASNVALSLGKRAGRNPRQLAQALLDALPRSDAIDRV